MTAMGRVRGSDASDTQACASGKTTPESVHLFGLHQLLARPLFNAWARVHNILLE
jgi:hypothetical protein